MRHCNILCPKLEDQVKAIDLTKLHFWLISNGWSANFAREGKICEYMNEDIAHSGVVAIYEYEDKHQHNARFISLLCEVYRMCINELTEKINDMSKLDMDHILELLGNNDSIYARITRKFITNETITSMIIERVSGKIELYEDRDEIYEQLIAKKGGYFFDTSIKSAILIVDKFTEYKFEM